MKTVNFLFIHVNEFSQREFSDAIPISQSYLLAHLKQHGFGGTILGDYKDWPLEPDRLRSVLSNERPAVVGFTVYEENINRVRVLARFAKKILPEALVVLGGPQITFMPAAGLLQMPEADILSRGEGETVILALARALSEGRSLAAVPGICYRENGLPLETVAAPPLENLDELASPYLDDTIDLSGKSRAILFSSRGCTSPCRFCYTARATGHRIRYHSVERVLAEIQHLQAKGIDDFWFADPNFAFRRERLENLLQLLSSRTPGIGFWCQTRYNHIDQDLLALLKKAGAHTIAFGLESADPSVLATIHKGLDLERMQQAIRDTLAAGIKVELFTIFGLPGETFQKALKTLNFVQQNGVAVEGNSISQQLHLFFGAPVAEEPHAYGMLPLPRSKPAYLGVSRDFATTAMSAAEIKKMSLLWRLNRTDFSDHVRSGRNLFSTAGFITAHHADLSCRPEADMLLALIYLQLEEYEKAQQALSRLLHRFPEESQVRDFLAQPLSGFRLKRRGEAGAGCRIIYDCQGQVDGRLVPATVCYYQDAVLGQNMLLPDFEKGISGLRAGRLTQFEVRFPAAYGNEELAGRTAVFQAFLHQVLEPVLAETNQDLPAVLPRNTYRFSDLTALRQHNENLYYLAMRDTAERGLTQDMTDFFKMLDFRLKLGFWEEADAMLQILPPDSDLAGHAGRILLANKRTAEALAFLSPGGNEETRINRIKALIELERFREAEELAQNPEFSGNIQVLDLLVGLASLQQLPLATYHARMDALLSHQVEALEKRA